MKTNFPDLSLDYSWRPIENPRPRTFRPEQIDHYNEHGYITGVPLYEGKELRDLQYLFLHSGQKLTSDGAFEPVHHKNPAIHDVVTNQRTISYLQDLLGPNIICHVSQYICKPPNQTKASGYHQDASFNAMDARCVIVWLAIDDAYVENGCMWFVPGSHKLGLVEFDERTDVAGGYVVRDHAQYGEPTPIELKAGQAVFMSDLIMHSTPPNRTKDRLRPGFTATYAPAEVKPLHPRTDRWAILCSGVNVNNNWTIHPRPQ